MQAQWVVHDNAIFDLCWTQVRRPVILFPSMPTRLRDARDLTDSSCISLLLPLSALLLLL